MPSTCWIEVRQSHVHDVVCTRPIHYHEMSEIIIIEKIMYCVYIVMFVATSNLKLPNIYIAPFFEITQSTLLHIYNIRLWSNNNSLEYKNIWKKKFRKLTWSANKKRINH